MTGADALSAGDEEGAESDVVGSSSSSGSTSTSSGSVSHERPAKDASVPQADASFDAATAAPPGFIDDFERPNAANVGNGWFEKSDLFSLSSGAVLQTGSGRYYNSIVSRPEVALDVQVAVDVTYGSNIDADPALHARMAPASDSEGELVGYTFYAYRDFAAIDREDPGNDGAELASAKISPELEDGKTYRMILRVTGTNPVKLEATILHPNGSPASTLSTTDASNDRITTGGRVGFGSAKAGTRWDDFERIDL